MYYFIRISKICIITSVVFSMLFAAPLQTQAIWGVGDVTTDPAVGASSGVSAGSGTARTALQVFDKVGQVVLIPVMKSLMTKMLNKVNDSITNWINSGFEGNPFYIDNPEQFFSNLALETASDIVGGIRTALVDNLDDIACANGSASCNQIVSSIAQRSVLLSLGENMFDTSSGKLKINGDTMAAFNNELLNDINPLEKNSGSISVLDTFKTNFSAGGTRGYEAILNDDNATPLGQYMNIVATVIEETAYENKKIDNSGKTLSDTKCKPGSTREVKNAAGDVISSKCLDYDVTTPNTVIDQQRNTALATKTSALESSGSSDNPWASAAQQVLSTALQSLVSNVMVAGFSQLTQLAGNAYEDPTTLSPTESFAAVTDTEELFQDIQSVNTPASIAAISYDIDSYLLGSPKQLQIQKSDVIVKMNNDIIRVENPYAETPIARAQMVTAPFTYGQTTINPANLEGNYKIIKIINDTNNLFAQDYYLFDAESDRYIFETQLGTTQGTLAFKRFGDVESRFEELLEVLRTQKTVIAQSAEIAKNIDQQCVLGADQGFGERLGYIGSTRSAKFQGKGDPDDPDNKFARAIEGYQAARLQALTETRTAVTLNDRFSRKYGGVVVEILKLTDQMGEIEYMIPDTAAKLGQIAALKDQYYNFQVGDYPTKEMLVRSIQSFQAKDFATLDFIEQNKDKITELEKTIQRFQGNLQECTNARIEAFKPNPDLSKIPLIETPQQLLDFKKRVILDNTGILYCPWEQPKDIALLPTGSISAFDSENEYWQDVRNKWVAGDYYDNGDAGECKAFAKEYSIDYDKVWGTVGGDVPTPNINNKPFTKGQLNAVGRTNACKNIDYYTDYYNRYYKNLVQNPPAVDLSGYAHNEKLSAKDINTEEQSTSDRKVIIKCADYYRSTIVDYLPQTTTL